MTTTDIPQPTFPFHAYGVSLNYLGEDGSMIAPGRIEPLRFVAACNRVARKEFGLSNVFDDPLMTLDDVLPAVVHRWAIPVPPIPEEHEWAITWRDVTEQTPGAQIFTVLDV